MWIIVICRLLTFRGHGRMGGPFFRLWCALLYKLPFMQAMGRIAEMYGIQGIITASKGGAASKIMEKKGRSNRERPFVFKDSLQGLLAGA